MQSKTKNNVLPSTAYIARRFNLPVHVADTVAQLAGLGRVGDWQPIGSAVVPVLLQAAASRQQRGRAA